jgi:hypothetical protein
VAERAEDGVVAVDDVIHGVGACHVADDERDAIVDLARLRRARAP